MKKLLATRRYTTFIILAATTALSFADTNAVAEEEVRAAAQKFFNSMSNGDFKAMLLGLPASHQQDLSSITKALGGKIDADIFKGVCEVLDAYADLGIEKSDMLAEAFDCVESAPKAAEIKAMATAFKDFVGKLELDTIQKWDFVKIISHPEFNAIYESMTNSFPRITITDIKLEDENTAVVNVKYSVARRGVMGREHNFYKIEGVWVSDFFGEDPKEALEEFLEYINKLEINADMKQKILDVVPLMKMGIEGAKKSKNPRQINTNLVFSFAPLIMLSDDSGKIFRSFTRF